jgi:hypothetical protein
VRKKESQKSQKEKDSHLLKKFILPIQQSKELSKL